MTGSSAIMNAPNEKTGEPISMLDTAPKAILATTNEAELEQSMETLRNMSQEEYDEFEKKLLWKIDLKIIPWMTLLFTMSFLDRVSTGTARLAGLERDLNMSGGQFNNVTVIFFVGYVVFEVPSNLVLKKVRPSIWIPLITVLWAIMQTCIGLVTTYHQLLALRFLLGVFESGLFPSISFFLTGWYRRKEMSKRISLFFAGAVLSGAFGGILGYGLSRMDGVGGKAGWSWIFIIEGLLTLVIGVASPWMVQDWPEQAKFLTPLERAAVLHRLKQDAGLGNEGEFSWNIIKRAALDWKTWLLMLTYIGVAEGIYSQSIFTPTIIRALGTWSTPQSLLLSTPPYAWGFFTTLLTAYFSDRTGKRGFFLMFWSLISVVGYILFITVPLSQPGVLYFAVFLTIGAIAPCIATTIVWAGGTFGNIIKRGTSMGLVFSLGNSGGIVASLVYRTSDAPRYITGHAVTLGFSAMAFICSILLYFGLKRENARREAQFGPLPPPASTKPGPAYIKGDERGASTDIHEDIDSPQYKERWGLSGMTRSEIIALGDDHPAHRFLL